MAGIVHFGRGTRGNGVLGGGRRRMVSVITVCIALIAGSFAAGAAAAPATGPGQGFTVSPADLAFILKQIKIAEAHVANTTAATGPCGALVGTGPDQIASPLLALGLRTVDGTCNNLQPNQSKFGAADEVFPRLAPAVNRPAEMSDPAFGPPHPTSYAQKKGSVFDSQPRMISNLIVDQTSANPAAVAAALRPVRTQKAGEPTAVPCATDPLSPTGADQVPLTPLGCTPKGETLFIPNVTTDVGLSPPFNSLFTLFGQFFDHGLDKVTNGGSGTVFVPLKSDDPLFNPAPGAPNFMAVTRSTNRPGPDGRTGDDPATVCTTAPTGLDTFPGTADDVPAVPAGCDESYDDIHEAVNTDTPFVDQSQTYTSHASHQVFLREYADNSAGEPVSTGKLLSNRSQAVNAPPGTEDGGMATWGILKANAETMLGLKIVDSDVGNIPLIAADAYGKFIPGPAHGLPQFVTKGLDNIAGTADDAFVEGNRTTPVPVPANGIRIETAFLNDIAHSAVPTAAGPDADGIAGGSLDTPIPAGTYDNELLDMHFTAGDGRTNENIGLTTIHQIFHSEHDRLVDDIKNVLLTDTSGETTLADWQTALGAPGGTPDPWNGERLFQAARFVTEMEYQHLVFEEFARKVQPAINPFQPFAFVQTNINPAITAEFAHAVYRFGHSMLTQTISRTNADGSSNDIPLFDGFLNPASYTNGGTAGVLNSREAAGSVIMGMSDQTGNEIDEFVTDTLRNHLVGLPLDLASINMARARSEGIPSLNNLRRQIFASTNDGQLAPYKNWTDFGLGLKHPESLINFVAAYGQHPTIQAETTVVGKRAAARAIVNPLPTDVPPADAFEFMDSTTDSVGDWANAAGGVSRTGLDDVDVWMGGLAENTNLFGGLLGSTFNYVFENQLTQLQNDDRLYYLARTPGMNLRTQLEGNSFSELMMRNTNAHSLKADPFATADCKFQLNNLAGTAAGYTANGPTVANDPTTDCDETALLTRGPDGRIRYRSINSVDPAGINGQSVYNGTDGVDRVYGGNDNDTFWGGNGNDIIEGNGGDDVALGGNGNDIITDLAGLDTLKGGPGNDAIDGGIGDDIIMGGDGKDFTNGGGNFNATFASFGDDFVIAGQGPDEVQGDSGDDWLEGGDQPDLLQGDSGTLLFDDHNLPGSDIFIGQAGDDDYDMEGGDDIGVAGPGIEKNAGSAGYDWSIGQSDPQPQDADLALPLIGVPLPINGVRDRFNEVEALSGWNFNDILRGDSIIPSAVGGGGFIGCDAIDQASLDRISGLADLLPDLSVRGGDVVPAGPIVAASATQHCLLKDVGVTGGVWGGGNILLGGAGSDLIEGRGGNDIIDGDKYLAVRLSVRTDPANAATESGTTDLMENTATSGNFGPDTAGMTLQAAVFAGLVDPGNIVAVREILTPATGNGADTALFSDVASNYTITAVPTPLNPGLHKVIVTHVAAGGGGGLRANDGTDTLTNIEQLQFSDQAIPVGAFSNTPASGTVNITSGLPATEGTPLTAVQAVIDPDGFNPATVALQWQSEVTPGTWVGVFNGPTFSPTNAAVGFPLRVVATFVDNFGVFETVIGQSTAAVINVNQPATGQPVLSSTTPEVGVALTASTASIADPDGLGPFSRLWLVNGVSTGVTTPSFTPGSGDLGKTVSLRVSFTDLHGTPESVTSSPSNAVVPAPAPVALITAGPLTFADQATGTASASQTITVANTGTGVLTATVILGGTNSADFVLTNGCTAAVTAGTSCTVGVVFAPTATGARTASVNIVHNAAGSPNVVTLTGTGTTPAPAILLTPPALAFASQVIGTTSAALVTTVKNTGTANLVITGVTRTGANPGQFTSATTCATVVPGGTCTVTVNFAPTTTGAKTANVNIVSNAVGSPHLVALTGTGIVLPPVASMPTQFDFGVRRINATNTKNFPVTNNGPGALRIGSITTDNPRFAARIGRCPASLAAGLTCNISISFSPLVVGPDSAVLTLNSNASNSPMTAILSGTGKP